MLSSIERVRLSVFLSGLARRVLIARLIMGILFGSVALSVVVVVVAWRGMNKSREGLTEWRR